MVSIWVKSRGCNTATGCGLWGAASLETSVMAGLSISTGNTVSLTLGYVNCGTLGSVPPGEVYSNQCTLGDVTYWVHVGAYCLMLNADTTTAADSSGDYTEYVYGGVVQGFMPR